MGEGSQWFVRDCVPVSGSRAPGDVRAAAFHVQGTVGDQGPAAQPQPGDGTGQEAGCEESDGDGGAFAVQKDRSEATHGGWVEEGD